MQERRLTRTGASIDPDRDLTFDELLGVGGEGSVYRGTWMSLPVAIKVLHDNRMAGDSMSNFRREARLEMTVWPGRMILCFRQPGVSLGASLRARLRNITRVCVTCRRKFFDAFAIRTS